MSAIDPGVASKVFEAIQTIRDRLPQAIAIVQIAAPQYAAPLEAGRVFLDRLFQVVSVLRSHDTVADAGAALRAQIEADWQKALRGP